MKNLEYRLIQDRHKKPLVVIDSPLGNGQEIYPDALPLKFKEAER
jgi:hypothetical protein